MQPVAIDRKTVTIWIVMDENGECEVATDETIAIDRWQTSEFAECFDSTSVCRVVQLKVTMSEPTGDSGSGAVVEVAVPDEAGHTAELDPDLIHLFEPVSKPPCRPGVAYARGLRRT